jgi:ribosome-interacting GTPase 1
LTATESEAASYEFTTLTCIPGVIDYKGANIQLLDLPGIIEGASQGKGRGRQVIVITHINYSVKIVRSLPCDFHMFGLLKKARSVCIFMLDNDAQEAVLQWFRQHPKESFAHGIH